MMDRLIVQPTATEQWRTLVNDAMRLSGNGLVEELESYLVFLLQRFTDRPEVAASILALEYLESTHRQGFARKEALRDVGDKCLLYSGFFPERAEKRNLSINYFVELGQCSYGALSLLQHAHQQIAKLFQALQQQFIHLVDVLFCIRELAGKKVGLSAIQVEELWREKGSQQALQMLRSYVHEALPIRNQQQNKYLH